MANHAEERTIGRETPARDWLTPLFGPERFHPVHDTMPLPGPHGDFTDYVDRLRAALDRATSGALPAGILENRLPFQWGPEGFDLSSAGGRFDGVGVLLVHGLMDCPFIMRDLASRFHVAGISHVALPVDGRNNPHYGHGGAYRYTLHYKLAADRRCALLEAEPDGLLHGETSVNHVALAKSLGRPLCRQTYNPDFDGMATAMTDFVAGLD